VKSLVLAAALLSAASLVAVAPANAAGCLKGAVVGGVAGHFMHRHTLLGAGVGCAIGHHEATKRARQDQRDDRR